MGPQGCAEAHESTFPESEGECQFRVSTLAFKPGFRAENMKVIRKLIHREGNVVF